MRAVRVEATPRAVEVVEWAKAHRRGALTITIGTGCCESTAPFLYEDFWPGPDQEVVGDVAGVPIYAPEYLRDLYRAHDGVLLDVVEELGESLSIETELGCRLALRGVHSDSTTEPHRCPTPGAVTGRAKELRPVVGKLPEALKRIRIR